MIVRKATLMFLFGLLTFFSVQAQSKSQTFSSKNGISFEIGTLHYDLGKIEPQKEYNIVIPIINRSTKPLIIKNFVSSFGGMAPIWPHPVHEGKRDNLLAKFKISGKGVFSKTLTLWLEDYPDPIVIKVTGEAG